MPVVSVLFRVALLGLFFASLHGPSAKAAESKPALLEKVEGRSLRILRTEQDVPIDYLSKTRDRRL